MSKMMNGKTSSLLLAALISAGIALPAGAAAVDPYSEGMRKVQKAIAAGELGAAEKGLQQLAQRYAKDPEILAMLGRVLYWLKRYDESIASFRAAQRLKPGPELAGELQRVETAQLLAQAERLAAQKQEAQAQGILMRLFQSGRDPYQSGLALARLQMRTGEYWEAGQVLSTMLQRYPKERDLVLLKAQALLGAGLPGETLSFLAERAETAQDPELLALRGRAQMRLERFGDAARSFAASLALADDAEVRQERERAETAELLERSKQLTAQGEQAQAQALLEGQFQAGRDPYGTGTRLAALYTRMGSHREAAAVYLELTRKYPKDLELAELYAGSLANSGRKEVALAFLDRLPGAQDHPRLAALRGRILFLQRLYPEAQLQYQKAQRLGAAGPEIEAELKELRTELAYQQLKTELAAGEFEAAQRLLTALAGSSYAKEARLLQLRTLLSRRQQTRAVEASTELYRDFPGDAEVAALHAEALLATGKGGEAEQVLDSLSAEDRERLKLEREDLFYRARANWVKAFAGLYRYSGRTGNESSVGLTGSQRFRSVTAVASALETTRFGATDPQLALDLYLARKPGRNFYGNLSATLSPGAHFLPVNSIGFELARSVVSVELAAGYTHLNFRGRGANIYTASALWYIPGTSLSLGEKLYTVPANSTLTSVTALRWQPGHRCQLYGALGIGNSSERIENTIGEQDLQRFDTYSLRAGGEYRFSSRYSAGGEASFESRRGLYDRSGATLFLKYWWP